jgi:hypothetical protein
VANDVGDKTKGGGCHSGPPTPVFMGWGQDALKRQHPMWQTVWPSVEHWNFCYSHPMSALAGNLKAMGEVMPFTLGAGLTPPPLEAPDVTDPAANGEAHDVETVSTIEPEEEGQQIAEAMNAANDEVKH